jgi:hypothetical protein
MKIDRQQYECKRYRYRYTTVKTHTPGTTTTTIGTHGPQTKLQPPAGKQLSTSVYGAYYPRSTHHSTLISLTTWP